MNQEIEKPQENCPTRDECADMYGDLRKLKVELNTALAGASIEAKRADEMQEKLAIAVEALERIANPLMYDGKIALEALKKI